MTIDFSGFGDNAFRLYHLGLRYTKPLTGGSADEDASGQVTASTTTAAFTTPATSAHSALVDEGCFINTAVWASRTGWQQPHAMGRGLFC